MPEGTRPGGASHVSLANNDEHLLLRTFSAKLSFFFFNFNIKGYFYKYSEVREIRRIGGDGAATLADGTLTGINNKNHFEGTGSCFDEAMPRSTQIFEGLSLRTRELSFSVLSAGPQHDHGRSPPAPSRLSGVSGVALDPGGRGACLPRPACSLAVSIRYAWTGFAGRQPTGRSGHRMASAEKLLRLRSS